MKTSRLGSPSGITIIEDLAESKACTFFGDSRQIRCLLLLTNLVVTSHRYLHFHAKDFEYFFATAAMKAEQVLDIEHQRLEMPLIQKLELQ